MPAEAVEVGEFAEHALVVVDDRDLHEAPSVSEVMPLCLRYHLARAADGGVTRARCSESGAGNSGVPLRFRAGVISVTVPDGNHEPDTQLMRDCSDKEAPYACSDRAADDP